MTIDFKIIKHDSLIWREAVKLREDVLRKPLGSFFTEEELEEEKQHIHVVGLFEDSVIGTAVLVPEGIKAKMQRVAVLESQRNNKIGAKMLLFCEEHLAKERFKSVYCHARNTAVNFYHNNGYSKIGSYFDEDGIPHLKMDKSL